MITGNSLLRIKTYTNEVKKGMQKHGGKNGKLYD